MILFILQSLCNCVNVAHETCKEASWFRQFPPNIDEKGSQIDFFLNTPAAPPAGPPRQPGEGVGELARRRASHSRSIAHCATPCTSARLTHLSASPNRSLSLSLSFAKLMTSCVCLNILRLIIEYGHDFMCLRGSVSLVPLV